MLCIFVRCMHSPRCSLNLVCLFLFFCHTVVARLTRLSNQFRYTNLFQSKHVIQHTVCYVVNLLSSVLVPCTWACIYVLRARTHTRTLALHWLYYYITVAFHLIVIFSYRSHFHLSFVFCPVLLFLYVARACVCECLRVRHTQQVVYVYGYNSTCLVLYKHGVYVV